jgi:hypothetical protein
MAQARTRARSSGPVRQARGGAQQGAQWLASLGLAGRGGFYLLVAYLTARLAVSGSAPQQANASGALATVTRPLLGRIVVGAVAVGLLCFGIESLVAAWRDRGRDGRHPVLTALRGVFYIALTYVPASYLYGNHQVGSEQQQRQSTSKLLGLAAGQEIVAALGALVVIVCGWQIYSAWRDDPVSRMDLAGKPAWVDRAVRITAGVGIVARAATILPVGVFLVIAAVQYDPNNAKGLDGELAALARNSWGRALLFVIAAGLLVFAVFSLLEARYRDPARE